MTATLCQNRTAPDAAVSLERDARLYWKLGHKKDLAATILKKTFPPSCVDAVLEQVFSVEPPILDGGADCKPLPEDIPLTDLGNAERLAHYHGDNIRFCKQHGKWYVWNGKYWQADDTGEVMRRAKDTVRRIYAEAEILKPSEGASKEERKAMEAKRETIARHALRSESDNALLSMLTLAESEEGIAIRSSDLDRDAYLFNVQNGTIDLRTGRIRPHKKTDLLTKCSPVYYDPAAIAPKWAAFTDKIMDSDMDMIVFIQKATGYSMTADVCEQILMFMYGTGANGKSTFAGVIEYILCDYFQKAPRSLIQSKRNGDESIPCDVARLQGARFVCCNELEEGRRIAESLVKDLTGGDRLVARFMRQDLFEFAPTHKLWLYGNHRPTITGTDEGIWRRIRLIPFTVSIAPAERNPHLKDELIREAPGILNWLIDGCLLWQKEGLAAPEKITAAVTEYREDMDTVGQFLDEACILGGTDWTASSVLHKSYSEWAESEGIEQRFQLGPKSFAGRLRDRGLRPEKDLRTQTRGWAGIRLSGGAL